MGAPFVITDAMRTKKVLTPVAKAAPKPKQVASAWNPTTTDEQKAAMDAAAAAQKSADEAGLNALLRGETEKKETPITTDALNLMYGGNMLREGLPPDLPGFPGFEQQLKLADLLSTFPPIEAQNRVDTANTDVLAAGLKPLAKLIDHYTGSKTAEGFLPQEDAISRLSGRIKQITDAYKAPQDAVKETVKELLAARKAASETSHGPTPEFAYKEGEKLVKELHGDLKKFGERRGDYETFKNQILYALKPDANGNVNLKNIDSVANTIGKTIQKQSAQSSDRDAERVEMLNTLDKVIAKAKGFFKGREELSKDEPSYRDYRDMLANGLSSMQRTLDLTEERNLALYYKRGAVRRWPDIKFMVSDTIDAYKNAALPVEKAPAAPAKRSSSPRQAAPAAQTTGPASLSQMTGKDLLNEYKSNKAGGK